MLWLNSERGRNEFVGSEGKAKYVGFLKPNSRPWLICLNAELATKRVSASLPLTLETIFGGTLPSGHYSSLALPPGVNQQQTCQLHPQVST